MTYQEEVSEAQAVFDRVEAGERRVDQDKWELARRTYKNTWDNGEQGRGDRLMVNHQPIQKVAISQWASDLNRPRFGTVTARLYRKVWGEKGSEYEQSVVTGSPLPWTEARWAPEVTNLDRQAELDRVNVHHITNLASPEAQAKVVEQLLGNPAIADRVAERVLSNPETVARVMRTESPASQAITAAVDTHRALAEVDRVFEHDAWPDRAGDEPRASYRDFQARTRDIIKHDPSSQHDRVMEILNGHMTEHPATDLAEALASSQHTVRVDVYETQAQMAIAWFQELLDGLRAASKPRLVAVR